MKSKKRYVIAFWIAASMVVALGIGMVAVLAAFTATAEGGFSVTYSATNVKASITATYDVFEVDDATYATKASNYDASGKTLSKTIGSVSFGDSNTSESAEGSLGTVSNFNINKKNIIIMKYSITNSGSAKILLSYSDDSATTGSNVTVRYSTNGKTWATSTAGIPAEINASETVDIFVNVSITNRTQTATLNATKFTINLGVL